jgi:pantothenate kinase type III
MLMAVDIGNTTVAIGLTRNIIAEIRKELGTDAVVVATGGFGEIGRAHV